jgi:hypothetical protein
MNWKSIRLELSSTRDFPAGSVARAYLLRLPLDGEDRVDADAFKRSPSRAIARRHWSAEPDEQGMLVRDGHDWAIRSSSNRRLLRLDAQRMHVGAEVSIVDMNGTVLPFRVASIR